MQKKDLIRSLKIQGFPLEIVNAFERVERRDFVPEKYRAESYKDIALPIGYGQTISQPYTIAFMLTLLELLNKKPMNILEVGSGSGYVLALIREISKNSKLYGIERIPELAERSKNLLIDKQITILMGDGSKGLPAEILGKLGGVDRILVSAASDRIPERLVRQLRIGGILVCPVKNSIVKLKKFANGTKLEEYPGFVFVPLVED